MESDIFDEQPLDPDPYLDEESPADDPPGWWYEYWDYLMEGE